MLLVRNKNGDQFTCTEAQFELHTKKLGKQWKVIAKDYVDKRKIIKQSITIPKETKEKIKQNGKNTIKTDNKTIKQNRSGSKRINK